MVDVSSTTIDRIADMLGMAVQQIFQVYTAAQSGLGLIEAVKAIVIVVLVVILLIFFFKKLKVLLKADSLKENLLIEDKSYYEQEIIVNNAFHDVIYAGVALVVGGILGSFLLGWFIDSIGFAILKQYYPQYFAIQQMIAQFPLK